VAEQNISRIESMLTVVGGKIVYEGAAALLAGTPRNRQFYCRACGMIMVS
jgi:hypothetical protein